MKEEICFREYGKEWSMKKGDIITCSNMHEAVEVQLELAIQGYDTSAYQTVSDEVIVKVGERSGIQE